MTIKKPVRVAIVSDQPIYRRGLANLLMSIKEVQLVGEAQDYAEAVQLAALVEPEVFMLDVKNPEERGNQLAAELHNRWSKMKLILLLNYADESQMQCDVEGGFEYCFSKDISEEEFTSALQQIGQSIYLERGETHPEPVRPTNIKPLVELSPTQLQPEGMPLGAIHAIDGPPLPLNMDQIQARLEHGEILTRELVMAGKIQADILPETTPTIRGWDIAANLESARETSGDFYDFIPLQNNNWGIVVADVTDKGMGAALFMALSSTLIRTYAARYPSLPALTLDVVNERLLSDTRGTMFITAFYCVLEPHIGRVRYVNAGHPPAILVSSQRGKSVDQLRPTGMALGVSEDTHWQQKIAKMIPGDVLVIYTDGITEAQSPRGVFYGDQRIIDIVRRERGKSARAIQQAVLDDVHQFIGDGTGQDDIAIIVIKSREIP